MKTVTFELYSVQELKTKFPESFEYAYEKYKDSVQEIHWTDEIIESLKELFKHAGIKLTNYSIGAYCYSSLSYDLDSDIKELSGSRAMAWLENNLYTYLRIPYKGDKRWDLAKYGKYYRSGKIKPGPFTGVCFDEDFMEALNKHILDGYTLGESFYHLADVARELFENELDYQLSEECFLEYSDDDYLEDGTKF